MELSQRAPRGVSRDRLMFSSSDDNAMLKQIVSTHAPDGREFEVRPMLHLVEDIFKRSEVTGPGMVPAGQPHSDILDDRIIRDMLEFLSYTINRVACEMSCKCMSGGDAHATAVNVFNILSSYSWDAKAVLALAAFAVGYGEFYLVAQLYTSNSLAKGVAALKQLPEIFERIDILKPKFDALKSLLSAMVELTKCIIELRELPLQYISPETPELETATSHIPTATYWIIRSVVACASQITGLVGMGAEYMASASEAWELSSLAHKINSIHDHLVKQLTRCHHLINEKKHIEAFQKLAKLFDMPHIDNIKILQALIYAKDDQPPLIDGSTKRRVGLEELRRKNVLLLISEIDIPAEELAILEQMYMEARQHPMRPESQYEIVWIPVVDTSVLWTDEMQRQFEATQLMMPWHSVHHPSLIDPAVIKYIKEVWKFNKKVVLVVLDPQGKVVNYNALHMMWIWGSLAYPFTSAKEEALWKEETWRIELLADTIEPLIFNWVSEGRYICLYGGEDMEWIRKFTTTARAVADASRVPLEMLYVGKSNPREKVRRNNAAIMQEKLSHTLPDLTLIWFFWVRLESMWHSKVQTGKSVENDPIMQEIMTMLTYDGSDQGWAVISRGSAEMAKAKGDTIVTTLKDYDNWKEKAHQKGFVPALKDRLQELHTPHHCTRLILPGTAGRIPERVVCAECGRAMEKFIMYRCCTD
ncbi:protein SIEVE ELEMENT OCCLUSION B-like [Punica granatum]|uniref:Uncharacterized protein n=2 Tax=Punica granatum TaxID=22663 RepID=A0A218XXY4_PUNGR|nr:protein SIEVE ELEMENT OCCLUSION B-like [Punica granatum]OWM89700.1 hypothetical protein CDL15_Pgr024448 [Punica granatum]PKI31150.1 hypothetical protein CRG98_048452 [Punica granatum]